MLETLQIQNFQAHAKLSLAFAPDVTTIVGDSDAGKSSIIRALRWVATNQPGGDAFVRHGAKGTTVKLTADGRVVTRRRSAKGDVNTYHLDGEEYKAFGRAVPDTVAGFLNMPDICWQGQHDPSFWFGETAGEVSRQLNAVVDLGVIDETLKNVGAVYGKARVDLEVAEKVLTEAQREHDGLAWVAGCDDALCVVEAAYGGAAAAREKATVLRTTAEAAVAHQLHLATLESRASAAQALFLAAQAAKVARQAANDLKAATATATKAAAVCAVPVPNFAPVHAAAKAAVVLTNRIKALRAVLGEVAAKETTLCQLRKTMEAARKAIPKMCPTCGASLQATSTSKHGHP